MAECMVEINILGLESFALRPSSRAPADPAGNNIVAPTKKRREIGGSEAPSFDRKGQDERTSSCELRDRKFLSFDFMQHGVGAPLRAAG